MNRSHKILVGTARIKPQENDKAMMTAVETNLEGAYSSLETALQRLEPLRGSDDPRMRHFADRVSRSIVQVRRRCYGLESAVAVVRTRGEK